MSYWFALLHPGWEHILWHETEIIEQIKEHVPFFLSTFISYKRPIKRHNSARLVVLYPMGGICSHCIWIMTTFPLKALNQLLAVVKPFLSVMKKMPVICSHKQSYGKRRKESILFAYTGQDDYARICSHKQGGNWS